MNIDTETLSRFAVYVTISVAWATIGYLTNVIENDHVEFNPTNYATTVLIGVIAGVIMAARGDEPTLGAYEAATAAAIPIADRIMNVVLNARRDDGGGGATEPTNDAGTTTPATESETKYR